MEQSDYDAYLKLFNLRDYDGVVAHFAPDGEVLFAGYCFKGHKAIREFYAFFHQHVNETIRVERFASSDRFVALEAIVRLEAKGPLTSQMLAERGLGNLFALKAGQVIEVPQFIHYHLEDGRFVKAVCLVETPAETTITHLQ